MLKILIEYFLDKSLENTKRNSILTKQLYSRLSLAVNQGCNIKGAGPLSKAFFVQCKFYRYICLILLEKQIDEV